MISKRCVRISRYRAQNDYTSESLQRMIAQNKAGTDNFSERARTRKSLPTSLCSVCRIDFELSIWGRWLLVSERTLVHIVARRYFEFRIIFELSTFKSWNRVITASDIKKSPKSRLKPVLKNIVLHSVQERNYHRNQRV